MHLLHDDTCSIDSVHFIVGAIINSPNLYRGKPRLSNVMQRPYVKIRSQSEVLGGHEFWEDAIEPTRVHTFSMTKEHCLMQKASAGHV